MSTKGSLLLNFNAHGASRKLETHLPPRVPLSHRPQTSGHAGGVGGHGDEQIQTAQDRAHAAASREGVQKQQAVLLKSGRLRGERTHGAAMEQRDGPFKRKTSSSRTPKRQVPWVKGLGWTWFLGSKFSHSPQSGGFGLDVGWFMFA